MSMASVFSDPVFALFLLSFTAIRDFEAFRYYSRTLLATPSPLSAKDFGFFGAIRSTFSHRGKEIVACLSPLETSSLSLTFPLLRPRIPLTFTQLITTLSPDVPSPPLFPSFQVLFPFSFPCYNMATVRCARSCLLPFLRCANLTCCRRPPVTFFFPPVQGGLGSQVGPFSEGR